MDINPTMARVRAVTFDAYGTIFNIEGVHTKATERNYLRHCV